MHAPRSQPAAASVPRARALLIGATLLWGISFPLLRGMELAQGARFATGSAFTLAALDMTARFGLAALLFIPFCGARLRKITREEWSQAGGLAVLCGFGLYLQTVGLAWTDASVSAFLTQLYTLLVPLIVALRDRRAPSLRTGLACALVLIGAALLSPGLMEHFRPGPGELLIVVSTFSLAGQIVWVERPRYASNRAGVVTLIMFALIAVGSGITLGLTGGTVSMARTALTGPGLWELLGALVLLCTAINFFIMNEWQRWVSATEAGLIYCLEPVIATALCAFLPGWISRLSGVDYPNEALTWHLLLGGSLVVAATILAATSRRRLT